MGHWLREPHSRAPDGRLLSDHVNYLQRELSKMGIEMFQKTCELMDADRKLKIVEEQIKDF